VKSLFYIFIPPTNLNKLLLKSFVQLKYFFISDQIRQQPNLYNTVCVRY